MSGLKRKVVTTLPTILEEGHEVFYNNNGTYTHYIGNSSNEPVPAKGYLEYVAILTQTLSTAPVATVLHNDLSGAIAWTRSAIGTYTGTLANEFTTGKTTVLIGDSLAHDFLNVIDATVGTTSTILVGTYENSVTAADGILENTTIIIRVYP